MSNMFNRHERKVDAARKAVRRAIDSATGRTWRYLHRAETYLALASGIVRPRVSAADVARQREERRQATEKRLASRLENAKRRLELAQARAALRAKKAAEKAPK